jgi:hypothetical protein
VARPSAESITAAPAMTRDELRLYCTRLYGRHRWQTALSRELQVNDRTVRRWVSGSVSGARCSRRKGRRRAARPDHFANSTVISLPP